ncbi:heterokaryon incompatibility protein-domain-containing protein, partial [Triangularia verruculosa]
MFAEHRGTTQAPPPSPITAVLEKKQAVFRLGIGVKAAPPGWNGDGHAMDLLFTADIQLLAPSSVPDQTFYGRTMDPVRVNMQLARSWIDECEDSHSAQCETLVSKNTPEGSVYTSFPPHSLRVINVKSLSLSQLPKNAKYVALSYCWGQSNRHFLTTKANITELQSARGISRVWEQLPGTIQDAIECVRELGYEFLWVDALCIIQDDNQDKAEQIKQMDRVYDSALLTIISAFEPTKNANTPGMMASFDGLPWYRPYSMDRRRCQTKAVIKELEISTTLSDVKIATWKSRWATRAWTFQEQLLSKRRLFFTNPQLYFQCSCGVFCEDVVGEGKSPSAYIHTRTSLYNESSLFHDYYSGSDGNARMLMRSKFASREEAFKYYGQLIDAYTRRTMTNQADELAALEGIMAVLRTTMGTEFIHGLP